MRDLAIAGDVDFSQLEHEQPIATNAAAVRGIHFRPARTRNACEDATPAKLLPQHICRRCVDGPRKSHFDSGRLAISTGEASSRCIDETHAIGDDTRVDRDGARMRTMLNTLAPSLARNEHMRCGRAADQRE